LASSLINIYKKVIFLIIILSVFISSENSFSADNSGTNQSNSQTGIVNQPQRPASVFNRYKPPIIIELEDNVENEQNQQTFSPEIYDMLKLKREEYRETPIRRGEIIFFVSFPWIYMYQILLLEMILNAGRFGGNGLNTYHYLYLLGSSALIAGFIAYDDNIYVYGGSSGRLKRRERYDIRLRLEILRYRF